MTNLNLSLPEDMRAFVETQTSRQGYSSTAEYLQALIRDAQERLARQELEAKLLEGLHSPAAEMTDADWETLRARIYERSPELRPRG